MEVTPKLSQVLIFLPPLLDVQVATTTTRFWNSKSTTGRSVRDEVVLVKKFASLEVHNHARMVFAHVRRLFHKHTYIGNAIYYSCLLSSADFVCQKIQNGVTSDFDFARTGRMAVLGCTYYGPFGTFIYNNLDKVLPGAATKTVLKKMLFDQFVLTSFGVCVFYVGKQTE